MSKDTIYRNQQHSGPFRFDDKVAAVFPDMIQRSVPGYDSIINGIQLIAKRLVKSNTRCYDLGCSLGAASLAMSQGITNENCEVIAVDNSAAMIKRCKLLIEAYHHTTPVNIKCANITDISISNASMVVLNFTLQFIEQSKRQDIINQIYLGLNKGGVLILSEKILGADKQVNQLLIDLHHDFKRANGYSELEISQKRNALENVLVPETAKQHQDRLKQAGFSHIDIWQQQYNFCSFIAIK